jgi:hypothetical protein
MLTGYADGLKMRLLERTRFSPALSEPASYRLALFNALQTNAIDRPRTAAIYRWRMPRARSSTTRSSSPARART